MSDPLIPSRTPTNEEIAVFNEWFNALGFTSDDGSLRGAAYQGFRYGLASRTPPEAPKGSLVSELLMALKALLVMMDREQPRKLDAALSWRENDDHARALAAAAIAKAERASASPEADQKATQGGTVEPRGSEVHNREGDSVCGLCRDDLE